MKTLKYIYIYIYIYKFWTFMNVDVHNLCLYVDHLGGIYVVEVL